MFVHLIPDLPQLSADLRRVGVIVSVEQQRATVGELDGVPTLYLDGDPVTAPRWVVLPSDPERVPSGTGQVIFSLLCSFGQSAGDKEAPTSHCCSITYPHDLWCGPNLLDITALYGHLTEVVVQHPEAAIFLAIDIDAPLWWADLYPNETSVDAKGQRGLQSMSSLVWRHQVGRKLRRLVEFITEGPFARNVVGYYLVSPSSTLRPSDYGLLDYSHPAAVGFRHWLSEQYGSDQELQAQWGLADITRENAQLPREATSPGESPSPQVLDALRYQAWATADALTFLCKLVKSVTDDHILTGTACTNLAIVHVPQAHAYWDELLVGSDAVDFIVASDAPRDVFENMQRTAGKNGKLFFGPVSSNCN